MRLATFLSPGSETPRAGEVREHDGAMRVFAYAEEGLTMLDRLADLDEAAPVERDSWALEEWTLLAPVPAPRAFSGIGLTDADHVREPVATAPEQPLVFLKLPSSAAA